MVTGNPYPVVMIEIVIVVIVTLIVTIVIVHSALVGDVYTASSYARDSTLLHSPHTHSNTNTNTGASGGYVEQSQYAQSFPTGFGRSLFAQFSCDSILHSNSAGNSGSYQLFGTSCTNTVHLTLLPTPLLTPPMVPPLLPLPHTLLLLFDSSHLPGPFHTN